ncbi:hypothetical protein D3C80_2000250 [compost metagenome]
MTESHSLAQLGPYKASCASKCFECCFLLLFTAQYAQIYLSLRKVASRFDSRYRNKTDSRILELSLNNLAELFFYLFANPTYPNFCHAILTSLLIP